MIFLCAIWNGFNVLYLDTSCANLRVFLYDVNGILCVCVSVCVCVCV